MLRFTVLSCLIGAALVACTAVTSRSAQGADTPASPNPSAPLDLRSYPADAKIKISCVGDSITLGAGTSPSSKTPINGYPGQLQRMLGDRFNVQNFGVSGTTLLTHGDRPYIKSDRYRPSLDFQPDVVILMLGTNDAKTEPNNWQYKNEYAADYRALAQSYLALPTHPRVFLCTPNFVVGDGNFTIKESAIEEQIAVIPALAKELHLGTIDVHDAMKSHPDEIPDHIHPNNQGAQVLAATVYQALMGKPYDGPSTILAKKPSPAATRP